MKVKKFLVIICLIFVSIFSTNIYTVKADNSVYLGGFPAGFSLKTKGAYIVGLCDVVGKNEISSPAKDVGLLIGDTILSIDNVETNNAKEIESAIMNKNTVLVKFERAGQICEKTVKLSKDVTGSNKLGVFIRDGINGIGTVTFIKNNVIASLGHPVINEKGQVIEIIDGDMYSCSITNVVKGAKGQPGELRGVFLRSMNFASIYKNSIFGVYSKKNKELINKNLQQIEVSEANMGDAKIITTIDGGNPKAYEVSIIRTSFIDKNVKNLVIKITDNELLEKTGGIVQGMSGSPIVQNGKLVGAVTHVFVNDPTRGYGISIDNMLNNM